MTLNDRHIKNFTPQTARICRFLRFQDKKISLKRLIFSDIPHFEVLSCDPPGARTQDPNIKSVVLYQLS